jgi:hypothetical protein
MLGRVSVFKKLKASEVPKRTRRRIPRFAKTEEWQSMKACFDAGLKPRDALQVILSAEDKKKYRIKNRRTVARFVRNYIAEHKLPYAVQSFTRDGSDFVIVKVR